MEVNGLNAIILTLKFDLPTVNMGGTLSLPVPVLYEREARFACAGRKNKKTFKMDLTIREVVLLSPPARRKRECRKRKKQRVKRSIFKSPAIDLSENSSEKRGR